MDHREKWNLYSFRVIWDILWGMDLGCEGEDYVVLGIFVLTLG